MSLHHQRLRPLLILLLLPFVTAIAAQENAGSGSDEPGLDQAEFERLHAELQPDTGPGAPSRGRSRFWMHSNLPQNRGNRCSSGPWTGIRWAAPETMVCSTVSRPLPIRELSAS